MTSPDSPVRIFTRIGHTEQNASWATCGPRFPVSDSGRQRVSPLWAWHPGGLQHCELWPLGTQQGGEQDEAQDGQRLSARCPGG